MNNQQNKQDLEKKYYEIHINIKEGLTEKYDEYNTTLYLRFVDLKMVFDLIVEFGEMVKAIENKLYRLDCTNHSGHKYGRNRKKFPMEE